MNLLSDEFDDDWGFDEGGVATEEQVEEKQEPKAEEPKAETPPKAIEPMAKPNPPAGSIDPELISMYQEVRPILEGVGDSTVADKVAAGLATFMHKKLGDVKAEVARVNEEMMMTTDEGKAIAELRRIDPDISLKTAQRLTAHAKRVFLEQSTAANNKVKGKPPFNKDQEIILSYMGLDGETLKKDMDGYKRGKHYNVYRDKGSGKETISYIIDTIK
jgi:hypothetical protein